jgi:hypothetical protein
MKIDRKSKVFAFCLILILFFPFISIVWGEINIKKAIDISVASDVRARTIKDLVGKYVSLDKSDPDISYELRKDGTVLIGISSTCSWKIEDSDMAIYCTYHTGSDMRKMRGWIEEEKIVWRGPFVPDIGISVKQKEAQLIKQEGKIKIWSMYTGKSSTLEFKKDGTVVWTPTLIGRWEKDRDTITIYCENNVCNKHQWRIKGDSLVGEGGMILVKQPLVSPDKIVLQFPLSGNSTKRIKERKSRGLWGFGANWTHMNLNPA